MPYLMKVIGMTAAKRAPTTPQATPVHCAVCQPTSSVTAMIQFFGSSQSAMRQASRDPLGRTSLLIGGDPFPSALLAAAGRMFLPDELGNDCRGEVRAGNGAQ